MRWQAGWSLMTRWNTIRTMSSSLTVGLVGCEVEVLSGRVRDYRFRLDGDRDLMLSATGLTLHLLSHIPPFCSSTTQ
jgi:hypothetical protein